MDFKKLVIGDIFTADDKLILTTTFTENKVKDWAVSINKSFFIDEFKGKTLIINSGKKVLKEKIIDIEVSSNISDYKNIHFIIGKSQMSKIKINDLVEVV